MIQATVTTDAHDERRVAEFDAVAVLRRMRAMRDVNDLVALIDAYLAKREKEQ